MAEQQARPLVVGVGEILWDLLPRGRQLGGAPANFAMHAAALGACGGLVSAVGDDQPGRDILDRLTPMGLELRLAVDPRHKTGVAEVTLDADGAPAFVISADAAWDHLEFTPALADLAGRADAICFGTLGQRSPASRQAIRQFIRSVRPGCLRVLDVNFRDGFNDRALLNDLARRCDVLKLNEHELPTLAALLQTPGQGLETIRTLMSRFPLRLVALTRGSAGARLEGIGESSLHEAVAAPREGLGDSVGLSDSVGLGDSSGPGDSIGAGDAFTAALTLGLLRGRALPWINALANRVAGYVCSQPGAAPTLPHEFRESLWRDDAANEQNGAP